MMHLYIAQDNALNYAVVRDFDRDDNDAAILDWDLSDDEIKMLIGAFPEVVPDDLEWEHWDLLACSMTQIESADAWLARYDEEVIA